MEQLFDGSYVWLLISTWISFGWLFMNPAMCKSNYDDVLFYDSKLYNLLKAISFIVIAVSLIILAVQTSFLTMLFAIGVLIVVQILNINILHRLYVAIFGYTGLGAILPFISSIVLSIALFYVQCS